MKRSDFFKKTTFGVLSAAGFGKWAGNGNAEEVPDKGSDDVIPTVGGDVETSGLGDGKETHRGIKKLIKPKRLKPCDTVGFLAPAGIVYDRSDFIRMEKVMDEFGLNVRFGDYVRVRHGYFSGTDHQRAMDLNRFFVDASIDAIVAARGGWGASRILPYLNFSSFRTHPKILCGFSDITTLHLAILKECGLVTFHGPNGASEWSELTKKSFKDVLMDGAKASYVSNGNVRTITPGRAAGPLIGGNLTILTTSLGTSYQPDCTGAILFLEDVGEPVYKIDRMLTHLKLAGILDGINGFIFGNCNDCPRPRPDHFTLEEIIRQHIEPLGIPAITGADISHGDDNFTIPMGVMAKLDAGEGVFELLERGVDDDLRSQISE